MSNKNNHKPQQQTSNEGEGSRTADRKYREGVAKHKKHNDVDAAAERARKALEGPEGKDLLDAEHKAAEGETQ